MDIQFYGANCVSLTLAGVRIVVDDNLADLGAKSVTKDGDIALFTGPHATEAGIHPKITMDYPGEYEVADLSIQGIAARAHIDEANTSNSTIYRLSANDLDVLVLGHIYPELSDRELEAIGNVDILTVPVGGSGYTLDSVGALKLIKAISPKLVIPTHYADDALHYPVPQQSLADALLGLAMEPTETTKKLRVKPASLTEAMQLVVLERS